VRVLFRRRLGGISSEESPQSGVCRHGIARQDL